MLDYFDCMASRRDGFKTNLDNCRIKYFEQAAKNTKIQYEIRNEATDIFGNKLPHTSAFYSNEHDLSKFWEEVRRLESIE